MIRLVATATCRNARPTFVLLILCMVVVATGCRQPHIDGIYGKRRGSDGGPSANGTAVLAAMFEEAGHRVSTWRRLSPKLEECHTIVWFPNDFKPPTVEQRDFLEWWLYNEPGRTVVYVGRDFDATPAYWNHVLPTAPPEQRMEVMRRAASAQAAHDAAQAQMPKDEKVEWFTIDRDKTHRKINSLSGPWSANVDAEATEIELASRLALPSKSDIEAWVDRDDNYWADEPEFTPLLQSEDDAIAYEINYPEWVDGKIIVINNGSFLLNLPLVNHEHRKLAGQLVSTCGEGRVVFLETGPGGPDIFDVEPGANIPTGFEVFTVWPLGVIVMHLTVMGILCCIAIFPIFGRPKETDNTSSQNAAASLVISEDQSGAVVHADFGKHITALGELLQKTEDRNYARDKVTYYHEHVSRDSGTSQRATK